MKSNIEKACVHGEEIVSYLYDEMPAAGRKEFETHLLECSSCTHEFAGLSLARLEVYEWNGREFAKLPTPPIVIPYEETVSVTWYESWFGPIFTTPKWAAGGVLAAAAIVFGFVLFPSGAIQTNVLISETKTTKNPAEVEYEAVAPVAAEGDQVAEVKSAKLLNKSNDDFLEVIPAETLASPVKRRKVDTRVVTARTVVKTKEIQPSAPLNAPRLTNFEDEDDNTLRLADLVADINTDQ